MQPRGSNRQPQARNPSNRGQSSRRGATAVSASSPASSPNIASNSPSTGSSSNSNVAFFNSASNVAVSGSQFTAYPGSTASVTVNIGNTGGDPPSRRSRQRQSNFVRVQQAAEPERPIRRSNVLYEEHLILKGRGYPLWIPSSNMNLPVPYRAKGVCIGDVGIITAYGGFDFLFNILLPADHPINPSRLPEGFAPLSPSLDIEDVRDFREFAKGSYLASSSVQKSGAEPSGLTFESSASEGAVLTMPDGSYHTELGNIAVFEDYVAEHVEEWYRFVNGPRGRNAKNGDVRLVIGCDKTTSWGMATFSNVTQQSRFRLKFRAVEAETASGPAPYAYAWEHSGMAEVRVGPDAEDNVELGATAERPLRNQCLFLRTVNATLSDDLWANLDPRRTVSVQAGASAQHSGPSSTTQPQASSGSTPTFGNQQLDIAGSNNHGVYPTQHASSVSVTSNAPAVPYGQPSTSSNFRTPALVAASRQPVESIPSSIQNTFPTPSPTQIREAFQQASALKSPPSYYNQNPSVKSSSTSAEEEKDVRAKFWKACTRCKVLKVRCKTTTETGPCKRCLDSGHECVIPGRKARKAHPNPTRREILQALEKLEQLDYQNDRELKSHVINVGSPVLSSTSAVGSHGFVNQNANGGDDTEASTSNLNQAVVASDDVETQDNLQELRTSEVIGSATSLELSLVEKRYEHEDDSNAEDYVDAEEGWSVGDEDVSYDLPLEQLADGLDDHNANSASIPILEKNNSVSSGSAKLPPEGPPLGLIGRAYSLYEDKGSPEVENETFFTASARSSNSRSSIAKRSSGKRGSPDSNDLSEKQGDPSMMIEYPAIGPNAVHPSTVINDFLLQQHSRAKMVITSDKDWQTRLPSDWSSLQPKELMTHIMSGRSFHVLEDSGLVRLKPLDIGNKLSFEELEFMSRPRVVQNFDAGCTFEEYLFGSDSDRRAFLDDLILSLRSWAITGLDDPFFRPDNLPGHPLRSFTLDGLLDTERPQDIFRSSVDMGSPEILQTAHAVSMPYGSHRAHLLVDVGRSLMVRYAQFKDRNDLERAIWHHKIAFDLYSTTQPHRIDYLECLLGLCSGLYWRYRLLRHKEDAEDLLKYLNLQREVDVEACLLPVKAIWAQHQVNSHLPGADDGPLVLSNQATLDQMRFREMYMPNATAGLAVKQVTKGACIECRKRKIKCRSRNDGTTCKQCMMTGTDCIYESATTSKSGKQNDSTGGNLVPNAPEGDIPQGDVRSNSSPRGPRSENLIPVQARYAPPPSLVAVHQHEHGVLNNFFKSLLAVKEPSSNHPATEASAPLQDTTQTSLSSSGPLSNDIRAKSVDSGPVETQDNGGLDSSGSDERNRPDWYEQEPAGSAGV